jgi:hypothetical protein
VGFWVLMLLSAVGSPLQVEFEAKPSGTLVLRAFLVNSSAQKVGFAQHPLEDVATLLLQDSSGKPVAVSDLRDQAQGPYRPEWSVRVLEPKQRLLLFEVHKTQEKDGTHTLRWGTSTAANVPSGKYRFRVAVDTRRVPPLEGKPEFWRGQFESSVVERVLR